MDKLNELLNELGITKVKLAEILGVSRQMVYNYLNEDDMYKWPKDKRLTILNLLDIKTPEELDDIRIDTDYIVEVDNRIGELSNKGNFSNRLVIDNEKNLFKGIGKKQSEVMYSIIDTMRSQLSDDKDKDALNTYKYLNHFLQSINTSPELKYILGYISKAAGFTNPKEFVFDEDEQFIFESILFSAMTLYNGGGTSKTKIAESHRRFVKQVEQKKDEKLSRTLELNSVRVQALRELGYDEINPENASEVFSKIAEIESRKINN